jgi:hypothetical protein
MCPCSGFFLCICVLLLSVDKRVAERFLFMKTNVLFCDLEFDALQAIGGGLGKTLCFVRAEFQLW